jgi:putative hydrolase of the HAD superfamily
VTLRDLVRDVDLLCLDAGNTVVFFDHARVARLASEVGHPVSTEALIRTEGDAKVAQEEGGRGCGRGLVDFDWDEMHAPGARGWGQVIGTILARAGVPAAALPAMARTLWREQMRFNLYSIVPPGLTGALDEARRAGVRVAIVSNSEGKLEELFASLRIGASFDIVVDSGIVGVLKPDPRIFHIALARAQVPPSRALMLGDTFATDIVGARAAGIRAALIDPHGHLTGRHADVPRVPGVVEVARALTRAARARA